MRRIYISGPLTTGDHWGNQRAAIDAADQLAELGYAVFIPHCNTDAWAVVYPHDYEFWMKQDFGMIDGCNALLRLPGLSPGADREIAYAQARDIFVGYSVREVHNHLRQRATLTGTSE